MGRRASSRPQLSPPHARCQASIVRFRIGAGAHASARSSLRSPRRAHRRGHRRRAGLARRRDRPAVSGLLLLIRLPRLSRRAGRTYRRPRVRRPDRGGGWPLPDHADGARGGRSWLDPLRDRARRAAPSAWTSARDVHARACSSGTSPPTSPCPLVMLAAGLFVFAQNPAAVPNRNFLVYMCLWAVSNVAVPEAVLGPRKYAAILVSFVPPLLSVHGWVFFLTYPANPARQAWLSAHRVIPRLYRAAFAVGIAGVDRLRGGVRRRAGAPRRRLALSGAPSAFSSRSPRCRSRSRSGRSSTRAAAPPLRSSISRRWCSCWASASGSDAGSRSCSRRSFTTTRAPWIPRSGRCSCSSIRSRSGTRRCATACSTPPW